ncbi:DUF6320 domain-containing protein [Butyrivibrio proteoclasticus]|uniref:DUF6320 domain-containing protein n=1 Tax=Butyrivibrio proteoclasticus TaxID=43305 RepID=UPI00047930D2|nr:DUF6320 domain-containing protein [Butyrivibrio proteoclasticus]
MQICPKCKVNIRGEKSCCPLCQSQLKKVEGELSPAFPTLKKKKISNITFIKVCTFLFVALEIIFFALHYVTQRQFSFFPIMILGTLVVWLTLITTIYLKNNMIKVITWEVIVAIIVDVYIDKATGFNGWSLHWMVPATLVALAIATITIAKMLKLRLDEYILYIVFDLLMALSQMIFIRLGQNRFIYPAVFSITFYLILTAALVIFRFRDLKNATQKMFNV